MEASTKSGKTVACMAWLIGQAWTRGADGRNFWWVAPVFRQTRIAYNRTVRMLRRMDPHKRLWDAHKGDMRITIKGRGDLVYLSGDDPDNLYGEDVYAAVIDEASRVKEASWHAIRSTLTATNGHIRLIGNVKGRKNWFYRLARKAEQGSDRMAYAKITAYDAVDAGVLNAEEIEDAQEMLPDDVFRELYLAEAAADEGNPFGLDAIQRCIGQQSTAPPVAWGVDLAKHSDWTVAIALDIEGRVCGFQRWRSDWHNTTARLEAMIADVPALVDSTGVGDPIVEELQRRASGVDGYRFHGGITGKQKLMEGLAVAIQRGEITFPAGPIVDELREFEYEVRIVNGRVTGVSYSAPEGLHDDCVCALAMAVRCYQQRPDGLTFDTGSSYDDDRAEDIWLDPLDAEEMWD